MKDTKKRESREPPMQSRSSLAHVAVNGCRSTPTLSKIEGTVTVAIHCGPHCTRSTKPLMVAAPVRPEQPPPPKKKRKKGLHFLFVEKNILLRGGVGLEERKKSVLQGRNGSVALTQPEKTSSCYHVF